MEGMKGVCVGGRMLFVRTHGPYELHGVGRDEQAGPKSCQVLGQAHGLLRGGCLQGSHAFRLPVALLVAEILAQGAVQAQRHFHGGPDKVAGDVHVVIHHGVVRAKEEEESSSEEEAGRIRPRLGTKAAAEGPQGMPCQEDDRKTRQSF